MHITVYTCDIRFCVFAFVRYFLILHLRHVPLRCAHDSLCMCHLEYGATNYINRTLFMIVLLSRLQPRCVLIQKILIILFPNARNGQRTRGRMAVSGDHLLVEIFFSAHKK